MRTLAETIVRRCYVVPQAEIIAMGDGEVCQNPYPTGVSYYSDGHGGGGAISDGDAGDDVDAKEYDWGMVEWN